MSTASPCNRICVIDPQTRYCRGCLRTIEEIAAWGNADEAWKRAVIERLDRRSIRKD